MARAIERRAALGILRALHRYAERPDGRRYFGFSGADIRPLPRPRTVVHSPA